MWIYGNVIVKISFGVIWSLRLPAVGNPRTCPIAAIVLGPLPQLFGEIALL